MLILTLKFILAHVIGDFLIQPDSWIKDKEVKKHKSKYLYWHLVVHFLALLIVLQFNLKYLGGILIIVASHYLIDLTKLLLNDKVNKRLLFFSDQILHIIVINGVVSYYNPFEIDFSVIFEPSNLLLITAIIFCTKVTSIIMKVIISQWDPENQLKSFQEKSIQNKDAIESKESMSLDNAGSFIGMLERLFIFGFILANQWAGIGFLLAAKSVFRFGDLSKATDRKLTEYIVIGTLLSFGFAIIIATIYLNLSGILVKQK